MSLGRRTVVLAALAAGGLVLLAAGQTWVHATRLGSGAVAEVTADGSDASGVISAMAFVVLAAGLALTIARRIGRWVVGMLLVLAGAALAVTAGQAVLDPAAAAAPDVSAATGTTEAAAAYTVTFWPWVAVAGGILAVLAGLASLVAGGRWSHSRRFEAPAAEGGGALPTGDGEARAAGEGQRRGAGEGSGGADGDEEELDPMDAWDELSAGNDPTG